MKRRVYFLIIASCVSIAAVAQPGPPSPPGGGSQNCSLTCAGIVDFYTHVSPAPPNGKYPRYAFLPDDGPCKRLWRVRSTETKNPDGPATEKRYAIVANYTPPCTPTPVDEAAELTESSFIEDPGETWTTLCYVDCVNRP